MNRRQFVLSVGMGAGLAHASQTQGTQSPPEKKRKVIEVQPDGPVVSGPISPMQIGTSAQLFIERSIVRDSERVWFTLHPGVKHPRNPVIRADRDWEGWRVKTYGNAIFDQEEKVFKMWYRSEPPPGYFPAGGDYSYYAVSKDGLEWEKPLVGTIPSLKPGFRHNVVLECQHANVFKDYAEPDPSRRYKAVLDAKPGEGEAVNPKHTFVSPDGLHWSRLSKKPVIDAVGDVTTAYHDEYRQIWVLFVKRHVIVLGQQRRCVGLMASKDFVNWSPPRSMFLPDYRDDAGSLGRAQRVQALLDMPISPNLLNTQYYGTGAYAAESCVVAFPWIFTMSNDGETSSKGPIEIQLAASRDLVNWERHFRMPCIQTGAASEWDSGLFYTQSQAFRHNDEVWLYYSASNYTHGLDNQRGQDRTKQTASIGLVKWKLDRFVSADAGVEGGVLTTEAFTHGGSHLELNARVRPGGSIRAEFLDATGRPIKEAGLSGPCTGDNLRSRVAWSNNPGIVDRLKGKPVSLRFHLRSAELYSFAFRS